MVHSFDHAVQGTRIPILWLEATHCGEVWWQETEVAAQIVYGGRRQREINANT